MIARGAEDFLVWVGMWGAQWGLAVGAGAVSECAGGAHGEAFLVAVFGAVFGDGELHFAVEGKFGWLDLVAFVAVDGLAGEGKF